MKITIEMTENEYQQMTQNAIKAKKYDELREELTSIVSLPTPNEFTMVRDLNRFQPYLTITDIELYKKIISWYERFR